MSKKSMTCTSSRTGKPLTEYASEREAERAASRYDHMTSYLCARCQKWHLSPVSHHTPCTTCEVCTDRHGKPKQSYVTRDAAERRALLIRVKRDVQLTVYRCRWSEGWHLTGKE